MKTMKKVLNIGILSGKGGVGKTSLAASLVSLASSDSEINALSMDCDVDAPNLALILPPSNNDIETIEIYTSKKAEFLPDLCIKCKRCVDERFCEFDALEWDPDKELPLVDYLACEGCGACKILCPEHAFKIENVKSGEIIAYKTYNDTPLIYGRTNLGSTTSGKLVTEVKDFAQESIESKNIDLMIIDGPPGIGCPVIATISGLDYIILITEPTPSGLHDLMRVIEVINQFDIPFGIVINKEDIKSSFKKKILKFIKKNNYYVLGLIKFDLTIPKAMATAMPVVIFAPESEVTQNIKDIYYNLKKVLMLNK
jgi:MinD superfamily P-loop ATPase